MAVLPVTAASSRRAVSSRARGPPAVAFVGKVVSDTRKRVDRRHVRPQATGQARRDRKVLVVRAREAQADGVRGVELYHSLPARRRDG